MASAIVHEGQSGKVSEADILGTTLFTLAASTFIVGLLIILVGDLLHLILPASYKDSCNPMMSVTSTVGNFMWITQPI